MITVDKCKLCESAEIAHFDPEVSLNKCSRCGFVFAGQAPTEAEIAGFYSRAGKYDGWILQERGRDLLWQRRLAIVMKYKSSGRLLDVGTGIGQFLYFAKNYFQADGTEVSESAIKIGREKYGVNIFSGDIRDINLQSKYDVITLFHVLEHVQNPAELVKICKSLLKKNGIFVVAVPNELFSIASLAKRALRFLGVGKYKNYGRYGIPKIVLDGGVSELHLSYFTPRVLKNLLEKYGFNIVGASLDPYYTSLGIRKLFDGVLYHFLKFVKKLSGINCYNTILLAAQNPND